MKTNIQNAGLMVALAIMIASCSEKSYENKLQGKVKKEEIAIAPKVSGRIATIWVHEGDTVNGGDTLAVIEVPEIEAKLRQAQGALVAARAQFRMASNGATSYERQQAVAKLNAATEQYNLTEKSFRRVEQMMNDSLIPVQKFDETYEKYAAARAQLDAVGAMKSDIDHGVRSEKIDMARGDMMRAEGAVQEAETAYGERYILAPKRMTIETAALRTGELALAGYNIFGGYSLNDAHLRFTVTEKQIARFKKGNTYNITVPATQATFEARLTGIRQLAGYADISTAFANYELGEGVYELRLVPVKPSDMNTLHSNMTIVMEELK